MDIRSRYQAYADAFEQSYIDDNWARIAPYFTDDAVYEAGLDDRAVGRAAVLEKFQAAVDGFDRRMDSRTPAFQPATVSGDTLTMQWAVTYSKSGLPDLVISGTETAHFKGDRIMLLRDDFDPEALAAMGKWMEAHGAALQG